MDQMAVVLKTVPGGGWAPVGVAPHTLGAQPRALCFSDRTIRYVGTVLGPNDARANPRGRATYELRITHQGVRFVQLPASPPGGLTPEELARRIRRRDYLSGRGTLLRSGWSDCCGVCPPVRTSDRRLRTGMTHAAHPPERPPRTPCAPRPATCAEIARSTEPSGTVAQRHGISAETVRKWLKRDVADCLDRSAGPIDCPGKRPRRSAYGAAARRRLRPPAQHQLSTR